MPDLTLVLEASAGSGSLALLRPGAVVAEAEVPMRGHDGERMMPALVEMLRVAGVSTADLARIVCGAGPGGFTSLRIAAAIAKGLACSLGVELWGVSSLALIAAGEFGDAAAAPGGRPVIAVLDALRGEWYAQRFTLHADGAVTAHGAPTRRDLASLAAELAAPLSAEAGTGGALIVGVGGDTFQGGRHALPRARDVARLNPGPLLYPVELAGWEPEYGRLAEAQVKWEQAHGRSLGAVG
ncbi:MAG: tRNA (adenosine(37)-N6)-threonylcarbamoyltransferase complex dimerization subunit type 1 TsaB [Gemmatimonadaceae bacterium]|nr:tRNA (adenosine(37)-N6)-threonylcarbamoyltransferase complex dimerization subunit type 1 TsaB [Gemmatimonadaceae bacterium]